MKLTFDFENCFGIRRMQQELNFNGKQSVAMIYAPNGMMKSSFANTLDCMSKATTAKPTKRGRAAAAAKDPICDRLNPDAGSKHVVKVDEEEIKPECIFVANPDQVDFKANKQVTDFLASVALKAEYDRIVGLLENAKDEFVKALKNISKSSDCSEELIKAFTGSEDATIYDCIEPVNEKMTTEATFYDFKYNNIFDKGGVVKKFLDDNRDLLSDYVVQYNRLLAESDLFHSSVDGKQFGTYQASQMGKAFKGEEYFAVGHKLVLRNDSAIESAQAFGEKIEQEKERIFDDTDLKKKFESIAKLLEANTDLRAFSEEITRHKEWIPKLENYEDFRIEVLLGYINHPEVRARFDELKRVFEENKVDLEHVIDQARLEQGQWDEILEIFKTRFFPPFEVSIENQENVLLRAEEAKLLFKYNDLDGHKIPQTRDSLLTILSKGERRAFLILQFLFAIEARKKLDDMSLIVLDDISDSFDYQNKYAIVEYIKDLAENYPNKFKIILLSHNFDFYRTVTLRLKGMVQQYKAVRGNDGTIRLERGVYVMKTPFEMEMKHSEKGANLIALIPFVRNLMEYYQEKDSPDFMTLTNCLHILERTEEITDSELVAIFKKLKRYEMKYEPQGEKVIDIIFREADAIEAADEVHELMIEDKVILSIAIRLKAEFFLKHELKAAGKTDEELKTTKNQTSEWIDLYKTLSPSFNNLKTMEKVNMMTPEYIHLNSFMYEPLIDMSVWHLIELYKEVKALLNP